MTCCNPFRPLTLAASAATATETSGGLSAGRPTTRPQLPAPPTSGSRVSAAADAFSGTTPPGGGQAPRGRAGTILLEATGAGGSRGWGWRRSWADDERPRRASHPPPTPPPRHPRRRGRCIAPAPLPPPRRPGHRGRCTPPAPPLRPCPRFAPLGDERGRGLPPAAQQRSGGPPPSDRRGGPPSFS